MEQTSGFVCTEKEMADHRDNGAVGLHWASADGIILWASRADYEPLGYTREEWVGHHATECHANHAASATCGSVSPRMRRSTTIRHVYVTRTAPCSTS